MRIAYVAPFGLRAKGTARARSLPLAQAVAGRGHEVALFIPPYDSPEDSGRNWRAGGVAVVNVPLPPGRQTTSWHLRLAWRLYLAVRRYGPDLVHVFKPKGPSGLVATAFWAAGSSRATPGSPRLVVDSDDWEGPGGWNDDPRAGYSPLMRRTFAWQERHGLSHAHAWTVTGACLRERAVGFGADAGKVFVLPNGIENERWALGNCEPPVAASQSVLLYTRFAGVRTADVAAIWQRVRALAPEAALTVVGRGLVGEERDLAAAAPGVKAAGWLEPAEMPATFARQAVAIVPWADTPPNRARSSAKVLELMAAGLPIVAYAVGDLPATLGDAGVLVPPGDEVAFAMSVVALLADPERALRLGAAARRRVLSDFTWDRLAETALSAYAAAHSRPSTFSR